MAFSLNSYPIVYRSKFDSSWTDEWLEKPHKTPAEEAALSEAERDALSSSRNHYDDMPLVNYTTQYGLGCFEGLKAFIFLNDANEPKRQASDIAHEIAHILLRHTPVNPFVPGGKREYSPTDELEAETLGPALLVSEAAALRAYRLIQTRQHSLFSLSNEWMVTEDVIRWRMNAVGANKRVKLAA